MTLLPEGEKICPFMSRPIETVWIRDGVDGDTHLFEVKCLGERCAAWTTMDGGYCFRIWDVQE